MMAGLALFVLALIIPAPEGMSPEAKRAAAVVLLMSVWWMTEAIEIALTSLLPLVLFPALGILPSSSVAPYYTDQIIFLFLGGFIVALAIQRWNLHRRIALHTIRRVGMQPTRIILGVMIATAFLSMWMSNTACSMMMFPIGMALVVQLASRPGEAPDRTVTDNFGSVLMLSIAYAASVGGIGTLIGTPTNLVFSGAARRLFPEAPEIGFLQWMMVGIPLVVVFLPILWIYLCRFGSAVPVHKIVFPGSETVIEDELRDMGSITREEKQVLAVWILMAGLWIFRSPITLGPVRIPGWSELFGQPAFLHDATVAMAMAILLCMIPVKHPRQVENSDRLATHLMDWQTIRYGVPWGILFLFGGGFALAGGMEQTGLSTWLGGLLEKLGGIPPVLLILVTCFGVVLLSEVASNTATAIMAMPILAATAVQIGVHPYILMISATIAASYGFMLPVATPPNAIVYSSGWIRAPQMARAGLVLDLLGVIMVTILIYTVAIPVLGITFGQLPPWAK
ncbi:MAG: DASS family sodium-coupled anion symporter [Acidobacteria bacterium]|nr:DASS family sodium-coupled anion symporter [Acidobacteriota bacterium]